MKKLALASILLLLVSSYVFAASVKEVSRLRIKEFQKILGKDKTVSPDFLRFTREGGEIFCLARDNATRDLGWYMVDPFSKKLLSSGDCPFKVFMQVAISPDGKGAFVFSQYPAAIRYLNTESKKWEMPYQNPKGEEGLFILSISPLTFVESQRAYSIFDMLDAKGFVKDTYIVRFPPSPFQINKVVSLSSLDKMARNFLDPNTSKNLRIQVDFLRYSSQDRLVYVLKTKTKTKTPVFKDYLVSFTPPAEVKLLEKVEGRILPLDYLADEGKVLYGMSSGKESQVILIKEGKKEKLLDAKAMAGSIMEKDRIGLAVIRGRKTSIFLGDTGEKPKEVLSLRNPYSIGFTKDGKKLILCGSDEIACYEISW